MLRKAPLHALLMLTAATAQAGFDEGLAAFNRHDYTTAYVEWKLLSDAGNRDAENNLGALYMNGFGVARNERRAMELFQDSNTAKARENQGLLYANGSSTPRNYVRAAQLLQSSAADGNPHANVGLAYLSMQGFGVPKDEDRARKLLNDALAAGIDDARPMLASLDTLQKQEADQKKAASDFHWEMARLLLRLVGLAAAIMALFRARKKRKALTTVFEKKSVPAPSPPATGSRDTAPASENYHSSEPVRVWINPVCEVLAMTSGFLFGIALLFGSFFLLGNRGIHDSAAGAVLIAMPALFGGLTLFLLIASFAGRDRPSLVISDAGLSCQFEKIFIPWRYLKDFSLTPRLNKSGDVIPGSYDLKITYLKPLSARGNAVDKSVSAVLSNAFTNPLDIAEKIRYHMLHASEAPLPASESTLSSTGRMRDNIPLFIMVIASSLTGLALTQVMFNADGHWFGFHPANGSPLAGIAGLAAGALLFIALIPQWRRISRHVNGGDGSLPLRRLAWLPVCLLLGYFPAAFSLPMMANLLVGTPYREHFAITGKFFEPQHGRSGPCNAVMAHEAGGSLDGKFCLSQNEFAIAEPGKSTLTVSGIHSRFGAQLASFTLDAPAEEPAPRPQPAATQDNAAPAPAPVAARAPAPPDNEAELAQQCVLLKRTDAAEQSLESHALMAQACARAGMSY